MGKLGGRGTQPVDRRNRSEGVVDSGRQRAQTDLDQFVDQELHVLAGRAHTAQRKAFADFVGRAVGHSVHTGPIGDGDIGVDEIAGPHGELELAVGFARDAFEPAEGDRLYVAGVMCGDRLAIRHGARLFPSVRFGVAFGDIGEQSRADILQHGVDPDRRGDVVQEIDQHRNGQRHQSKSDQQRQLGHKTGEGGRGGVFYVGRRFVLRAHGAQYGDGKDEGADEGCEAVLVAAIFHEIGQKPRTVIAAGIGHSGDGDREDGGSDADHRSRNDRQDIAGPVWACGLQPADIAQEVRPAAAIEPQGYQRKPHCAQCEQRGQKPVAGIDVAPDLTQSRNHAPFPSSASMRPKACAISARSLSNCAQAIAWSRRSLAHWRRKASIPSGQLRASSKAHRRQ